MAIQIGGNNVVDNNRKGLFLSCNIGVYTTGTRPGSPSTGDIIYNSTEGRVEVWSGSAWESAGSSAIYAIGGTTWESTQGSNLYRYHAFTGSDTFKIITPSGGNIDVLAIAGGGGGGAGRWGGGGGAGGLLTATGSVTAGNNTVTVGSGGNGMPYKSTYSNSAPLFTAGTKGGNSSVGGVTALGGGAHHSPSSLKNGGSGAGGGAITTAAGSGTPGQGTNGGTGGFVYPGDEIYFTGGGGGGAGQAGQAAPGPDITAGNGGNGLPSTTIGSSLYPGVAWDIPASYGTPGPAPGRWFAGGGAGGGGQGGSGSRSTAAQPNTGSGGGAGGFRAENNYNGSSGGSGIVFVRYLIGPTA